MAYYQHGQLSDTLPLLPKPSTQYNGRKDRNIKMSRDFLYIRNSSLYSSEPKKQVTDSFKQNEPNPPFPKFSSVLKSMKIKKGKKKHKEKVNESHVDVDIIFTDGNAFTQRYERIQDKGAGPTEKQVGQTAEKDLKTTQEEIQTLCQNYAKGVAIFEEKYKKLCNEGLIPQNEICSDKKDHNRDCYSVESKPANHTQDIQSTLFQTYYIGVAVIRPYLARVCTLRFKKLIKHPLASLWDKLRITFNSECCSNFGIVSAFFSCFSEKFQCVQYYLLVGFSESILATEGLQHSHDCSVLLKDGCETRIAINLTTINKMVWNGCFLLLTRDQKPVTFDDLQKVLGNENEEDSPPPYNVATFMPNPNGYITTTASPFSETGHVSNDVSVQDNQKCKAEEDFATFFQSNDTENASPFDPQSSITKEADNVTQINHSHSETNQSESFADNFCTFEANTSPEGSLNKSSRPERNAVPNSSFDWLNEALTNLKSEVQRIQPSLAKSQTQVPSNFYGSGELVKPSALKQFFADERQKVVSNPITPPTIKSSEQLPERQEDEVSIISIVEKNEINKNFKPPVPPKPMIVKQKVEQSTIVNNLQLITTIPQEESESRQGNILHSPIAKDENKSAQDVEVSSFPLPLEEIKNNERYDEIADKPSTEINRQQLLQEIQSGKFCLRKATDPSNPEDTDSPHSKDFGFEEEQQTVVETINPAVSNQHVVVKKEEEEISKSRDKLLEDIRSGVTLRKTNKANKRNKTNTLFFNSILLLDVFQHDTHPPSIEISGSNNGESETEFNDDDWI